MKKFIKPSFKKSNLNISATLAEFLGAPNKNTTLPILKKELKKNYKNVVFICLDGLGINPIKINLKKDDFLRKNIKQVLRSTFPSTTTNATTSLMENQLPLEHGWFGWSMNFEELNKNVDIFLNQDSWTGENLNINESNSPLGKLDYYFDNAKTEYKINSLFPSYVEVKNNKNNNVYTSMDDFFDKIKSICDRNGKQFVYAYYFDPDTTMHKHGVSSKKAYNVINTLSAKAKTLFENTNDSLFIITADHGQIDINGYVELYNDKILLDMLKIYPFMEARAPAFIVKKGRHKEFESYFKKTYGKDFKLYKSSQLLKKGYFGGRGDKSHLLGDYIAIGTYTHKQAILTPKMVYFKGHHTSLTEEMLVPLIILKN